MRLINRLAIVGLLVGITWYSVFDEPRKSFAQEADPSAAAFWKLDEVSGTTAADSSPNANDGTLVNMDPATDWIQGKIGGALDFDGINDYLEVNDSTSLDYSTFSGATVSGWVKAQRINHTDEQTLYGHWVTSSRARYRAVVAMFWWPSSAPTSWMLAPVSRRSLATLCLSAWAVTSPNLAFLPYRARFCPLVADKLGGTITLPLQTFGNGGSVDRIDPGF